MNWSDYWKPKPGPLFTWGRFMHGIVGALISLACALQWDYGGLAVAVVFAALFGFAWEHFTSKIAVLAAFVQRHRWAHLFGDVKDLYAYEIGAIVFGLLIAVPDVKADTEITSLPFTASTNSERYYLTGDLSTTSTGINITGTGVTIDLQGNTISQSGGSATWLIDVNAANAIIEDGFFISETGSERCIDATSGTNVTLRRLWVYNSVGSYASYHNSGAYTAESCFFYSSGLQAMYFHDGSSSATLINVTAISEAQPALYTRMDAGDTMAATNCVFARGSAGGTSSYVFETRNAAWAGLTATYNHFYRTSGTALIRYQGTTYTDAETFEANSTDGDPLFVNWTTTPTGDWALQSGSVCIDDGTNTPVTSATDVVRQTRIVNTTVDKGAWEFQGGGGGGDPTGACCDPDGSCAITTEAACSGTYEGDDAVCSPNPCPQPNSGACCYTSGQCEITTEAGCSGIYEGDSTLCSPNPCEAHGGDSVDLSNLPAHPRFWLTDAMIDTLRVEVASGQPKFAIFNDIRDECEDDIAQDSNVAIRPLGYYIVGRILDDQTFIDKAKTLYLNHYATSWASGDHLRVLGFDWLYNEFSPAERTAIETYARGVYSSNGGASSRRRYMNLAVNEASKPGIAALVFHGTPGGNDAHWQTIADEWADQFLGTGPWDVDEGTAQFVGGLLAINDTYYPDGMHHKGVHYAMNKIQEDLMMFYYAWKALGLGNEATDAKYARHYGEQVSWYMRPDGLGSRIQNGELFWMDERGSLAGAIASDLFDDSLIRWSLEKKFPLGWVGGGSVYKYATTLAAWRTRGGSTAPSDSLPLYRFFGSNGLDNTFGVGNWAEHVYIRNGWNIGPSSNDLYFSISGRDYFEGFQFYPGALELFGYGGVLLNQGGRYAVCSSPGSSCYGHDGHENDYHNRTVSRNTVAIIDPSISDDLGAMWGSDHQYNDHPDRGPGNLFEVDNDTRFDVADIDRFDAELDPNGANLYYTRVRVNPEAAYVINERAIDLQEREVAVSWPYLVVRDHVDTDDSSYYLKVLWHSIHTPAMSGAETGQVVANHVEDFELDRVTIGNGVRGKLIIDPLLPSDATVRRVGGTGYEFWSYDPTDESGTNFFLGDTLQETNEYEAGQWRIETTAPEGTTLADFVHVLQALPSASSPVATAPIDSATAIGAEFDAHAYVFGKAPGDSLERIFRTSDADTMMLYLFRMAADSLFSIAVGGDTVQVLCDGGPIMVEVPSGITHVFVGDSEGGPATGACCFPNGSCVVTTEASCAGDYQGDETTCTPNPCPVPVGACCADNGSCAVTTEAACGGAWQGADTVCSPNPCPFPTGRCCFDDATCTDDLTEAECANAGGYDWLEDGTCSGNPCTGRGACCIDGSCFDDRTPTDCATSGGTWQGAGTDCDPDPCVIVTGACCVSEVCTITTEVGCAGVYQGDGTDCVPDPCAADPTGACCDPGTGACVVLTEDLCTAPLEYQGDGTDCDPNPCPEPPATGACCIAQECLILDSGDCTSAGGTYRGDGTICTPNPCALTGACCLGTNCQILSAAGCSFFGGIYQGNGSDCDPDPCAPAPPSTPAEYFQTAAWWTTGQTLAAGAAFTGPWIAPAARMSWCAAYATNNAPTIALEVSFDGGRTAIPLYSELGSTGPLAMRVQRSSVANPGAPSGGPSGIPAESIGVPAIPGALVRMVVTANAAGGLTQGTFALMGSPE